MKKIYLSVLCLIGTTLISTAQVIGLDSTFGINARQTFERGTGNSFFYDVEKQADGQILAAGVMSNATDDIFIMRSTPSGMADNSFGLSGKALIDLGGDELANDIALQSDGKIVVCGNKKQSGQANQFLLCRLQTNGTLDSTFGNQGVISFSQVLGNNTSSATWRNVRVQPDGKILVIGYAYVNSFDYRGVIQRYQTNGTPDSSFGTNGSLFVRFTTGSHNYGESIHVLSSGKILVLGSSYFSAYAMRLMRLHANGMTDSTFGTNGVSAIVLTGHSNVYPNWFTELPDGKILTVGFAYNGTNQRIYSSRHSSTGQLDPIYAINGFATYNATSGNNYAYDAFLHSNGDCSIAAECYDAGVGVAAILKIDSSGSLVNTFGTTGTATYPIGNFAFGNALTSNQDSLYLVGGTYQNTNRYNEAYITKQHPDGVTVSAFGTGGIVKGGNGKSPSKANKIFRMSSGNLLITGTHSNLNNDQFAAKLDPNGMPINSYGDQGFSIFDINKDETVRDAILIQQDKLLLLSETGNQTIAFTSPSVSLMGPTHYSFSVIDSSGVPELSSQSNFTITASQFPRAAKIREDNNGKFVVLASSSQAVNSTFYLIRHNSNFSVDNSFGTSGKISMPGRTTCVFTGLGDLQIAPDNDAVVLNWFSDACATPPYSNFTIKKYKEDGTLDNSFGAFGTYANDDTIGSDPNTVVHLWKFSSGYVADYVKDGICKIRGISFGGTPNLGPVELGDVRVTEMKELPDSSFLITMYKDTLCRIVHLFPNGTINTAFNGTGAIEEIPFITKNRIVGMTLSADTSIVLYHQLQSGSNDVALGLSKLSAKTIVQPNNVETHQQNQLISIYPNPFSGRLNITSTSASFLLNESSFELYSMQGSLIPIRIDPISDKRIAIESKMMLASGTYILKAYHPNGEMSLHTLSYR
jgi:uncharacterized delta-60 repeat protein